MKEALPSPLLRLLGAWANPARLRARLHHVLPPYARAKYALLSADPIVILAPHFYDEALMRRHLGRLIDRMRGRNAHILHFWAWDMEIPERVAARAAFEERRRRSHPRLRFTHLCNTERTRDLFLEHGLAAIHCNQNAFVDERIFRPLPDSDRHWDSVYDARLAPYKRHHLAERIESLALLYDFEPTVENFRHIRATRTKFAGAHFFNHERGADYRSLGAAEVNERLNRCRVGLCLSAVEGAMFASVQYLLAGLPVVTTRSRGGRDEFFDDEDVVTVDDDSAAVGRAVRALIERNPAPEPIRSRVLARIAPHRERFIALVQLIYDAQGQGRSFSKEWDGLFVDKLGFQVREHAATIEELGL